MGSYSSAPCIAGSGGAPVPRGGAAGEPLKPWWKCEAEMDRLMGTTMPLRVDRVSPPPKTHLGYEMLDYKTGKGDVIRVKGSESPVVVSRVRFLYDFVGGQYRLRTKILEVQTPRRFIVNEQLDKMVPK